MRAPWITMDKHDSLFLTHSAHFVFLSICLSISLYSYIVVVVHLYVSVCQSWLICLSACLSVSPVARPDSLQICRGAYAVCPFFWGTSWFYAFAMWMSSIIIDTSSPCLSRRHDRHASNFRLVLNYTHAHIHTCTHTHIHTSMHQPAHALHPVTYVQDLQI